MECGRIRRAALIGAAALLAASCGGDEASSSDGLAERTEATPDDSSSTTASTPVTMTTTTAPPPVATPIVACPDLATVATLVSFLGDGVTVTPDEVRPGQDLGCKISDAKGSYVWFYVTRENVDADVAGLRQLVQAANQDADEIDRRYDSSFDDGDVLGAVDLNHIGDRSVDGTQWLGGAFAAVVTGDVLCAIPAFGSSFYGFDADPPAGVLDQVRGLVRHACGLA